MPEENKWSVKIEDFQFLTVIGRGSYAKVVNLISFNSSYLGCSSRAQENETNICHKNNKEANV